MPRKFFMVVAVVMATLGCACVSPTQKKDPEAVARREVVREVESATVALVHIVPEEQDDPQAYCAGVWVGPRHVLTALHCFADEDNSFFILTSPKGVIIPALGVAGDLRTDLALIETVEPPRHPIARLASRSPTPGDLVHVVGHTAGLPWTYCAGTIAAVRRGAVGPRGGSVNALQVSALVWFGNSGGGAWNESGELIGISSWVSVRGPGLSFFVGPGEVRHFLDTTM